jgi:hypothetical protein
MDGSARDTNDEGHPKTKFLATINPNDSHSKKASSDVRTALVVGKFGDPVAGFCEN